MLKTDNLKISNIFGILHSKIECSIPFLQFSSSRFNWNTPESSAVYHHCILFQELQYQAC